jgi:hypothetical protein
MSTHLPGRLHRVVKRLSQDFIGGAGPGTLAWLMVCLCYRLSAFLQQSTVIAATAIKMGIVDQ